MRVITSDGRSPHRPFDVLRHYHRIGRDWGCSGAVISLPGGWERPPWCLLYVPCRIWRILSRLLFSSPIKWQNTILHGYLNVRHPVYRRTKRRAERGATTDRDMIWRFGRHVALVVLVCGVAGNRAISLLRRAGRRPFSSKSTRGYSKCPK